MSEPLNAIIMSEPLNAIILADSVNSVEAEHRATTILFPRFPYRLIQEIGTHRQLDPQGLHSLNPFGVEFGRNSASSRAMPVSKVIERIELDPYVPHWTRANKGMQGIDDLNGDEALERTRIWTTAMKLAFGHAIALEAIHSSKQDCNALLLPFMRIPIIVTGTEWGHFFGLRTEAGTHPDFRAIALEAQSLYESSTPNRLSPGEWHIPWIKEDEWEKSVRDRLKISTARSAWLSYAAHDQDATDFKAFTKHDELLVNKHLSCFEHQLIATEESDDYSRFHSFLPGTGKLAHTRNLNGFISYRALIEDGVDICDLDRF